MFNEMKSDINKHVEQLTFIFLQALFLASFGGCTCLETVRAMLKKVASNQVLALYSLRGKKGKKPFQDHLMYRVVLPSKLHKAKRQEVEDSLIEMLKHAPHMPGGPKYKKPAARHHPQDVSSDSE